MGGCCTKNSSAVEPERGYDNYPSRASRRVDGPVSNLGSVAKKHEAARQEMRAKKDQQSTYEPLAQRGVRVQQGITRSSSVLDPAEAVITSNNSRSGGGGSSHPRRDSFGPSPHERMDGSFGSQSFGERQRSRNHREDGRSNVSSLNQSRSRGSGSLQQRPAVFEL